MGSCTILLVDPDHRRRATVGAMLSIQPHSPAYYTDAEDLRKNWSPEGVPVAHDSGSLLADLLELMDDKADFRPLVAYSEDPRLSRVVDAIHRGALDYLQLPFSSEELHASIARASKRGDATCAGKQRALSARALVENLSRRERQVCAGLTRGHSNKRMARDLGISPRTVEIHRSNMMHKLGTSHPAHAVRIAIEAKVAS